MLRPQKRARGEDKKARGEDKKTRFVARDHGKKVSLELALTVPSADEECPISMEPMSACALGFLPAESCLLLTHPQHSKATITACGHSFGALSLLYHFAGNSLNCPCCRAGSSEVTLATKCLPVHLRSAFARQVCRIRTICSRSSIFKPFARVCRFSNHLLVFHRVQNKTCSRAQKHSPK